MDKGPPSWEHMTDYILEEGQGTHPIRWRRNLSQWPTKPWGHNQAQQKYLLLGAGAGWTIKRATWKWQENWEVTGCRTGTPPKMNNVLDVAIINKTGQPKRRAVKINRSCRNIWPKISFDLYVFLDFGQNFPPPSFCIVPTYIISRKLIHITNEPLHSSVNTTAI